MRSREIGKKAQVDEFLLEIPRMAYLLGITVATLFVIALLFSRTSDAEIVEIKVLNNRMIHETSLYDKQTGRTYVGIIDPSLSSGGNVDERIKFGHEARIAATMTIGTAKITYNEKWFTLLKPRIGFDVKKNEEDVYVILNGQAQIASIEVLK